MTHSTIEKYARTFEVLTADTLDSLLLQMDTHVHFRDPFNDLIGSNAVRQLFAHMYAEHPYACFQVEDVTSKDAQGYIRWVFSPSPQKALTIHGVSHVSLTSSGLVKEHLDYWDSASELFVKLPLVRHPMRWLLQRLAAPIANPRGNNNDPT